VRLARLVGVGHPYLLQGTHGSFHGNELALPYRGQMYDWFIGAMPAGQLDTAYGVPDSYTANATGVGRHCLAR
jgi:hypothetical protein